MTHTALALAVSAALAALLACEAMADAVPLVTVDEREDAVVFQTQWYRAELDRTTVQN